MFPYNLQGSRGCLECLAKTEGYVEYTILKYMFIAVVYDWCGWDYVVLSLRIRVSI